MNQSHFTSVLRSEEPHSANESRIRGILSKGVEGPPKRLERGEATKRMEWEMWVLSSYPRFTLERVGLHRRGTAEARNTGAISGWILDSATRAMPSIRHLVKKQGARVH